MIKDRDRTVGIEKLKTSTKWVSPLMCDPAVGRRCGHPLSQDGNNGIFSQRNTPGTLHYN